jgi:hypothetical protein
MEKLEYENVSSTMKKERLKLRHYLFFLIFFFNFVKNTKFLLAIIDEIKKKLFV